MCERLRDFTAYCNKIFFSELFNLIRINMKRKFIILFLSAIFCLIYLDSCKKEKAGQGSKTSVNGGTESHNVGEACMECHNSGGSNQYWWSVAGTVYKPDSTTLNPNGTVYLFSAPSGGGSVVLSLPVDAKANFYTTNAITFGVGLYPAVKSLSGQLRYMNSFTTQGNCNSCHNASNRIKVN